MYSSSGIAFAEKPYSGIVTPIRLYDASRFKNHGVHTNITMVQLPKELWVRSFNGLNSFIDCGSDSSLTILRSFTIMVWVKLDVVVASQPDGFPGLLDKQGTGGGNRNYAILIRRADDRFQFNARNAAGSAYIFDATAVVVSTYLDDLEYHQIVGVWDRDTQIAYVYIDAVEREKLTGQTDGDLITTGNLALGRLYGQADTFLDGQEALPRVLHYALSPGRIKNIYEKQLRDWFI